MIDLISLASSYRSFVGGWALKVGCVGQMVEYPALVRRTMRGSKLTAECQAPCKITTVGFAELSIISIELCE